MSMWTRHGVVVGGVGWLLLACSGKVDLRTMPEGSGAAAGSGATSGGTEAEGGGGSGPSSGGGSSGSNQGVAGSGARAGEGPTRPSPSCLDEPDCPWSLGGTMPMHSRGHAVVEYGGSFYLFGGSSPELDSVEIPIDAPELQHHTVVLRYDPVTQEFTTLASMLAGLYSMTAHVLGDKIYVFGGYGEDGFNNIVQIYDPAEDSWTTGPSVPTKRYIFSSEAVDGKVYVTGGQGPTAKPDEWRYTSVVEVFDPGSGWSTVTPAPRILGEYASCALNGRIYAFGGAAGNRTQIYDVASDTWTEAAPPPHPRYGHTCVRVGDALIVLGGGVENGPVTDLVERYHPDDDSWETLDPLPTARHRFAAAALDQRIYVFGGDADGVGTLDSIEILDASKL